MVVESKLELNKEAEPNCSNGIRKKISKLELLGDLLIPGSLVKLCNRAIKKHPYNTKEKIYTWASALFGEGVRISAYGMLIHNLYEISSKF